jgi:dipeptidyl aminopeptidase/acylaminoacyl peptidase
MKYIISLLIFLGGLTAQAQSSRAINPMDVASLKSVSSATWSADGSVIAYTQRVQSDPTIENKPAHSELHLLDVPSGLSTAFVTRGSVREANFRPRHANITFLNRLEGDKVTGLYEIGLHGGEASLLYQFKTSIKSYQWSPDGQTLAFIAGEPAEKEKSNLPYQPELYEQDMTFSRLYVVEPGKGAAKEVETEGNFSSIAWSPDGTKLVCAIAPTPLVDDAYMAQTITIMDVSSMKVIGTVDHQGKLGDIIWSPEGNQIAFIAGADINDPTDGRLFVVSANGGKPIMLNAGWKGMFEQIEWTTKDEIDFLGSMGTEAIMGKISPTAKAKPEVIKIEEGFNITHFETASNSAKLVIADRYNHPTELFVIMKDQSGYKRLTNSNSWLSEIAFAKQEVIRYTARDGLEIEGILIRPLNEEKGKRYPLITVVHGGPESHHNNGWLTHYSSVGQMGAGKGYAVFYPNYRGSTGRGLEFTLSSQGQPAEEEFDDIVDGVDYLIEMGLVDKTKVGVTGGSYGGYATGWLSTRYSDRFAAGVMFVGISDKVSKWGTTDIPNEEYLVHARKWVYEDYEFFLKRSPIYYADQCKTPLMIAAGKNDTRVHPSQSMELYRHIKSRTDTPVELVLYPGEGHGNANSTARYDYNLRVLGWFDTYLKEGGKS